VAAVAADGTVQVSDWVVDRLAREGVGHVFLVSGGGAMFLIDALGREPRLAYVPTHHEQAAAMAAEAYARVAGGIGVALVTTGPAATNAITGVGCAWTDSIPLLVISGQAKTTSLVGDTGLRQRGFHEVAITKIVAPITKYAACVMDPREIGYHLEKALFLARHGRPGPVWVDVPLDIQGARIDPARLRVFDPALEFPELLAHPAVPEAGELVARLRTAKRPVILAGHGLKLAGMRRELLGLVARAGVPVVTTRSAFDVIHHDHPLRAGFVGNFGQRAGNFTVQNADFLLALGTRMAVTTVGYEADLFARGAFRAAVDVDPVQLRHASVPLDLAIRADLRDFLPQLEAALGEAPLPDWSRWHRRIRRWQRLFPNVTKAMRSRRDYVSSYVFYEVLAEEMEAGDTLVWDQGASYHCAAVAFRAREGQRAFSNEGFTPMGYGLPAAVGACFAGGRRRLVCVHGDGGLMLNVQELQTVRHHRLPIKLFVFNNQGYTSIKHTQQMYFEGRFVGVDPSSGLSCPDIRTLAAGFGLPALRIATHRGMRAAIRKALALEGPVVVEVVLDPLQAIEPRVKSERLPDGRMVSKPLEDMWPYLDRELFRREMIVPPLEG
jgi:acetolactate synthase-1/2/3 large subunit